MVSAANVQAVAGFTVPEIEHQRLGSRRFLESDQPQFLTEVSILVGTIKYAQCTGAVHGVPGCGQRAC